MALGENYRYFVNNFLLTNPVFNFFRKINNPDDDKLKTIIKLAIINLRKYVNDIKLGNDDEYETYERYKELMLKIIDGINIDKMIDMRNNLEKTYVDKVSGYSYIYDLITQYPDSYQFIQYGLNKELENIIPCPNHLTYTVRIYYYTVKLLLCYIYYIYQSRNSSSKTTLWNSFQQNGDRFTTGNGNYMICNRCGKRVINNY